MNIDELEDIAIYLRDKGIRFAIKEDYIKHTISIVGIKITKDGKFYRANGKIIAGNIAAYLI